MFSLMRKFRWLALSGGIAASVLLAADPPPKVHQVSIENLAFKPIRLDVQAGDIVEWQNDDLVPHTATAQDQSWDTGQLAPGAKGRVTVTKPGMVQYFCLYHPQMKASVVVKASASTR